MGHVSYWKTGLTLKTLSTHLEYLQLDTHTTLYSNMIPSLAGLITTAVSCLGFERMQNTGHMVVLSESVPFLWLSHTNGEDTGCVKKTFAISVDSWCTYKSHLLICVCPAEGCLANSGAYMWNEPAWCVCGGALLWAMSSWEVRLNCKYSKQGSRLGEMVRLYFPKTIPSDKDSILKPTQAFCMYQHFLWV